MPASGNGKRPTAAGGSDKAADWVLSVRCLSPQQHPPVETSAVQTASSNFKVVYLGTGAAGMYCGSCLHDNALVAALRRLGHDVVLVPLYTPIRTDEPNQSLPQVFFGGLNVYLQQVFPPFRYTPRWLDRLLDSGPVMRLLARRRGAVDARKLGPLTISMLQGREGNQRKELERLLDWLRQEGPPQLVHLSNALLLGLAPDLKHHLGVPVVCNLSGEDIFLDALKPSYREQAWQLLRKNASFVDCFVALNRYYALAMASRLRVPEAQVAVIPHGLNLQGVPQRTWPDGPPERLTVGFLARICPEKGLHLAAEAVLEYNASGPKVPAVLHAAGYLSSAERKYLRGIQRRFARAGQADRFRYFGEPDRQEKFRLLAGCDLFCLPTVYRESKGLSALEALACGVPVAVPRHGAFPELVEQTGGGWLLEPECVGPIVELLHQAAAAPEELARRGRQGSRVIRTHFTDEQMARRTAALYHRLCSTGSESSARPLEECP